MLATKNDTFETVSSSSVADISTLYESLQFEEYTSQSSWRILMLPSSSFLSTREENFDETQHTQGI